MINLIEIIKTECLPRRNCMLSVFEDAGESGFLYFKDAQLIEVNSGKLWANDALKLMLGWQLSSYTLGELPRGIKRTIWEPLDRVIEDLVGAEAAHGLKDAIGDFATGGPSSGPMPVLPLAMQDPFLWFVDKLETLSGFICAMKDDGENIIPLIGKVPDQVLSPDWFRQFSEKVAVLGQSLGAGEAEEWYLETELCRVWRFHIHERYIIVFASLEVLPDEFEEAFWQVVGVDG
ncbi:MAG: hypothetical protein SFU85_08270 [Candidatus Methylacidiphilales bacterium]|nr:hypothetical protein [Candidatus Methylacidiphilales bacterium]